MALCIKSKKHSGRTEGGLDESYYTNVTEIDITVDETGFGREMGGSDSEGEQETQVS